MVLGDPWGLFGETSGGLRGDVGLLWITWGAFWGPLDCPLEGSVGFLGGLWDALSALLGVLGGPFGLWEHWAALTGSPEFILGDSCSESNGSKGDPWGTLEVL